MREIKIKIYGRVQGVNFRVMTRDFCDENEIIPYGLITQEDPDYVY